jgi:hypothetical protein
MDKICHLAVGATALLASSSLLVATAPTASAHYRYAYHGKDLISVSETHGFGSVCDREVDGNAVYAIWTQGPLPLVASGPVRRATAAIGRSCRHPGRRSRSWAIWPCAHAAWMLEGSCWRPRGAPTDLTGDQHDRAVPYATVRSGSPGAERPRVRQTESAADLGRWRRCRRSGDSWGDRDRVRRWYGSGDLGSWHTFGKAIATESTIQHVLARDGVLMFGDSIGVQDGERLWPPA